MSEGDLRREIRKWRTIAIAFGIAAFIVLVAGLVGTSIALSQAVRSRDAESKARQEADMQRDAAVAARAEAEAQRKSSEAEHARAARLEKEANQSAEQLKKIADFQEDLLKKADANMADIENGTTKPAPKGGG